LCLLPLIIQFIWGLKPITPRQREQLLIKQGYICIERCEDN
jgi:hypothetical protein